MFRDGRKPGRMNNLNKMAANKTLEEKKMLEMARKNTYIKKTAFLSLSEV